MDRLHCTISFRPLHLFREKRRRGTSESRSPIFVTYANGTGKEVGLGRVQLLGIKNQYLFSFFLLWNGIKESITSYKESILNQFPIDSVPDRPNARKKRERERERERNASHSHNAPPIASPTVGRRHAHSPPQTYCIFSTSTYTHTHTGAPMFFHNGEGPTLCVEKGWPYTF